MLVRLWRLTLDPVQPSRAKANWLMGDTTRSTLTALHSLCPACFVWSTSSSSSSQRLRSLIWTRLCGSDSGVLTVRRPFSVAVSGCLVRRLSFSVSLKMEKHLSKRSMLEEGRPGPSLDSRYEFLVVFWYNRKPWRENECGKGGKTFRTLLTFPPVTACDLITQNLPAIPTRKPLWASAPPLCPPLGELSGSQHHGPTAFLWRHKTL